MMVDAWKASNPGPRRVFDGTIEREETTAEYEAAAVSGAILAQQQAARKLAGQQELEDLGFTMTQARNAYTALKAGTATLPVTQKALAAVMRYLWRDLLEG